MALSYEEAKSIAELKYHGGFRLLLDALQAHIDDISNDLASATPDKESGILGQWRASRDIYTILKLHPEQYAIQLLELNPDPINSQIDGQQLPLPIAEEKQLQLDFIKAGGKIDPKDVI